MNSPSSISWRYWHDARIEFASRIMSPFNHPTFIAYFLFFVIGISPLGIWLELARGTNGLDVSIFTCAVALAATSMWQVLVNSEISKPVKTMLLGFVTLFFIVLGITNGTLPVYRYLAWTGFLLALFLWWFANADTDELRDDPDAPTGGAIDRPLAGDTANFTT